MSVECCLDTVSIIIEKDGVVNVVFLVEFAEKKFQKMRLYTCQTAGCRENFLSRGWLQRTASIDYR